MPTVAANALNISQIGIQVFDGVASFAGTTTTQYNTLVGNTNNTIANVTPGSLGQVLTSNGNAANPTYQTLPFTQMPWTDKAISFAAVAGNGYFITANATATLPAGAQGNVISFVVDDPTAILTIQADTGQILQIGKVISAATGTAVSNFNGDSVTLVYRLSDTKWLSQSVNGTWTVN